MSDTAGAAGKEGATGRVSQGITGTGEADSTSRGAGATGVTGAQTSSTSLGESHAMAGGSDLGIGESAAGGLGLAGDREARLRAPSMGASDSASSLTKGAGSPVLESEMAEGADGAEAHAGLRGTAAMGDDRRDMEAATPDKQDGTTTAALGGSAIDRVTTGQGGDVGGSVTGPG